MTTPETGITRYNPATNDCRHFEQEPYTVSYNIDTLTKIAEGGGRLWIKMNNWGFGYYDRERDVVEPFYNDPKRPDCQMTNAVVRFDVQDDVLWLSTYSERGLRKAVLLRQPAEVFTLESESANPLSGEIRALMTDSRGRVWVGTRDGELIAFDASNRPVYTLPRQTPRGTGMIYALREDSSGNIWVGTKGEGLYRMTPAGKGYRITHFMHADSDPWSLSDNQVYCVEEDDEGRIWVATYGGGINLLEDPAGQRFLHAGNQMSHYPLDEAGRVRWLLYDRPTGCWPPRSTDCWFSIRSPGAPDAFPPGAEDPGRRLVAGQQRHHPHAQGQGRSHLAGDLRRRAEPHRGLRRNGNAALPVL